MMKLTRDCDFKKVYTQGKSVADRYFRVKYIANRLGRLRVAVVVPGRLAIAVVRNRMRRRVFSAIRKLNISCFAVDVVVFPGMKAKNACFVDILASLQGIFEKL